MADEFLQEISRKLDVIIRLSLQKYLSDMNKIEATKFCSDIGLSNKEISTIFNIKSNVVSARLSEAKKGSK